MDIAIEDKLENYGVGFTPIQNDQDLHASKELPHRTHQAALRTFPNCALQAVQVGIARENWGASKLRALSGDVKEKLAQIDLLLELNTELTSFTDKDSYKFTPKSQDLFKQLNAKGINVWKEGDTISREQLSELKAQISSQIDKLRTALQTTVSTEIQPETNNLNAIMNAIQQTIQSVARLIKKILELPR